MSYRQEEEYRYDERRDAAFARSLTHACRIRILRQLRHAPATATQLEVCHPLGRFALAKHIRMLVLGGLVSYNLQRGTAIYKLSAKPWPRWFQSFIDRKHSIAPAHQARA